MPPWTPSPGDHVYVHAIFDGKSVNRPYTPSSLPGTVGFFDLPVKRYETVVISKCLHFQGLNDPVLMSGPRQGGHCVDGMAKKVRVRRWRHWHYADDFDHPLIFTKRLAAGLLLVFANKTRPTVFFETSGSRMSERIRTSIVIMSWNSRRQDGQREAGESPLIFFAGIFLLPVQSPYSSSADQRR